MDHRFIGPEHQAQYQAAVARKQRLGLMVAPRVQTSMDRGFDLHGPSRIALCAKGTSAYLERKAIAEPEWPDQPPAVFYDDAAPAPRGRLSAAAIMEQVCRKYLVTIAELVSERRYRRIVAARHEAILRMTVELHMSSAAIGRRLNRDHTSILYALRKVAADPAVADAIERTVSEKKVSRRKMIERAIDMRAAGCSVFEIMEALPLARSTIEKALREMGSGK